MGLSIKKNLRSLYKDLFNEHHLLQFEIQSWVAMMAFKLQLVALLQLGMVGCSYLLILEYSSFHFR